MDEPAGLVRDLCRRSSSRSCLSEKDDRSESTVESWQPRQVRREIDSHAASVRKVRNRLLAEPQIPVLVEAQRTGVPSLDDQS